LKTHWFEHGGGLLLYRLDIGAGAVDQDDEVVGLCRAPDYAASECVRAGGGVSEVFGDGIIPVAAGSVIGGLLGAGNVPKPRRRS